MSNSIFQPVANVRAAQGAGVDAREAIGQPEFHDEGMVAAAAETAEPTDDLLSLLDGNAKDVVATVRSGDLSDEDRARLHQAETDGKARKSVLAALDG